MSLIRSGSDSFEKMSHMIDKGLDIGLFNEEEVISMILSFLYKPALCLSPDNIITGLLVNFRSPKSLDLS